MYGAVDPGQYRGLAGDVPSTLLLSMHLEAPLCFQPSMSVGEEGPASMLVGGTGVHINHTDTLSLYPVSRQASPGPERRLLYHTDGRPYSFQGELTFVNYCNSPWCPSSFVFYIRRTIFIRLVYISVF